MTCIMLCNKNSREGVKQTEKYSPRLYPYSHNREMFVSASAALDNYIQKWEEKNGKINVGQPILPADDKFLRILKLLWKVITGLLTDNKKAYDFMYESNKTMADALDELEELNTLPEDKISEYDGLLRSMSTRTLLMMDPRFPFTDPCIIRSWKQKRRPYKRRTKSRRTRGSSNCESSLRPTWNVNYRNKTRKYQTYD